MAEYISKEDAINALLNKGQHSRRYRLGETWELNLMEIQEAINAIPAAHLRLVISHDNCIVCGRDVRKDNVYYDVNGRTICESCINTTMGVQKNGR